MILRHHVCRSALARITPSSTRRCLTTAALDGLQKPVQSYISASRDPYLNLSIEHHLLQTAAPESAILFLYVNRPSIIIGRNQNPWLEVNLALLNPFWTHQNQPETEPPGIGAVDLVRRRSGGGTVFHDEGNVNWTVICPSASFTRDKHAEMVVRALRGCGVERARVNARHDIVLDQGKRGCEPDPEDTHSTPFEATDFDTPTPLKVSGSAYKLTRKRALHHGTCLLSSPNLNIIPDYLHSPAKPYLTARGVESVSSPVGNILLSNDEFITSVQRQFSKEYGVSHDLTPTRVDEDWLQDESVHKGYTELKSLEWTYLQTPQFTISTKSQVLADVNLEFAARYGAITEGQLIANAAAEGSTTHLNENIIGQRIHEIDSWEKILGTELDRLTTSQKSSLVQWLQKMLPKA